MEHYQNTMPQLTINAPYGSNFVTIPDFFISRWKTLAVVERLFWQMGTCFSARCRCREVAVVGRFKKESCGTGKRRMDFPAGQKKVAVVERWPLVEVRQYTLQSKTNFRAKGLGHFELTIIETLIKTRRKSTTPSTKWFNVTGKHSQKWPI